MNKQTDSLFISFLTLLSVLRNVILFIQRLLELGQKSSVGGGIVAPSFYYWAVTVAAFDED